MVSIAPSQHLLEEGAFYPLSRRERTEKLMEFRGLFRVTKLVNGCPDSNLGVFTDVCCPTPFQNGMELGTGDSANSWKML